MGGEDPTAGDVLIIGDLMVDVVARYEGSISYGSDTAARIQLSGGGSAANTAAWLAVAGEPPRLLAAVGDDELGRQAMADLADGGVQFVGPVLEDVATGTCVVLVGPDRERTMLPDRGANDRLSVAAVDAAFRPSPGWVHLSGYTLLGEGSRPAGIAALSAAKSVGAVVSIDAASAAPLGVVGAEAFLAWIEGVSILFANDGELGALGGLDAVLSKVATVVVKYGASGASWTDGATTVSADAVAVKAVDSTGAGDAFAAGWIAARRRGNDEAGCLHAAVGQGAIAVSRSGARPEH